MTHKHIYITKIVKGIYQLEADFHIQTALRLKTGIKSGYMILRPDGMLELSKGYVCDGASGPTINSKSSFRGAFTHDALYRMLRRGLLSNDSGSNRKYADQLFHALILEDGMWGWRAKYWYWGVRVGGVSTSKYNAKDGVTLVMP